jgi:uncharacterized protein YukE
MSYRSLFILGDDAWPGLKFNPAKGDLDAIDDLASDVKAVSTELDQLDKLLASVGKNGGTWEGDAADRFAEKLGKLPKYLQQGADSMGDCAKALRSWHSQLSSYQRRARELESEAVTARREADRLNRHLPGTHPGGMLCHQMTRGKRETVVHGLRTWSHRRRPGDRFRNWGTRG